MHLTRIELKSPKIALITLTEIYERFKCIFFTKCEIIQAKRSLPVLDTPFVTSWELFNIGLTIFGAYADYLSFEPEDPDPLEDFGDELEEFKEELMEFTEKIEMFTEKMDPDCKLTFDPAN